MGLCEELEDVSNFLLVIEGRFVGRGQGPYGGRGGRLPRAGGGDLRLSGAGACAMPASLRCSAHQCIAKSQNLFYSFFGECFTVFVTFNPLPPSDAVRKQKKN